MIKTKSIKKYIKRLKKILTFRIIDDFYINEKKIFNLKGHVILLTIIFGLYFFLNKGLFLVENIDDGLRFIGYYSIITIALIFLINIFFLFLFKTFLKSNKFFIFIIIVFFLLFLFIDGILDSYSSFKLTFLIGFIILFFLSILIFFILSIKIADNKKSINNIIVYYKDIALLFIYGLIGILIVIKLFSVLPSNYLFGGFKPVNGILVIKKEKIVDFYKSLKFSKNNIWYNEYNFGYDKKNKEGARFLNVKDLKYSNENDIFYKDNIKLLFQDSKYYYINLKNNYNVINISKNLAKFFDTDSGNIPISNNKVFNIIGTDILNNYQNILNSDVDELFRINLKLLEKLSPVQIEKNEKLKYNEIGRFLIEISALNYLNYKKNFNKDEYNNIKNILKGNKIDNNKKIKLFGGYCYSDLIRDGLDERYGRFIELYLILANKVNNKKFYNSNEILFYGIEKLEKCLFYNECNYKNKIFNFEPTGIFSKEHLINRYGDIIKGFRYSFGNNYDIKLLNYISGKEKVIKY